MNYIKILGVTKIKFDFYHIDAFEVANFEPIWRALVNKGVDAVMVAVPDHRNTATRGWFDFDSFSTYCADRNIPYLTSPRHGSIFGITTQNAYILNNYKKRVRLMYGPAPYTPGWAMQRTTVEAFDAVLVHGDYHAKRFSHWLPSNRLPVIGYPRYDDLFGGRLSREIIRKKWGIHDRRPLVMFLPTWAGNTAFDLFFPELLNLSQYFQIVVRPHHCTIRFESGRMAQLRASGFLVLEGAYDLPDAIFCADVVISDVRSGSMFEAIAAGIPTVGMVLNSGDDLPWLIEGGVDQIAPLCTDPSELLEAIETVLVGQRYSAERLRWAEHHVAWRDGSAAEHAADALIRLAEGNKIQVTASKVHKHKVSVVLPTYNHADFLPNAVKAIVSQTLTDFELIIVNDGSTDSTASYLATLRDPRIKIIERENGGLPSALNCGFDAASGRYFTWTSADNITAPTWLEILVDSLDKAPESVGFVSSGFAYINEHDELGAVFHGQSMGYDKMAAANTGNASFLYRASVAEMVGKYDESLTGAEDWDMWLRILDVCDGLYVDYVLYYYRLHSNSMTRSIPTKIREASVAVIAKLRERQGGKFDIYRFYPRLRDAKDLKLASWQAKVRLANSLMTSRFCPVAWSVELFVEALNENYSSEIHFNLILLLCRHGQWSLALESLDGLSGNNSADTDDVLRQMIVTQDTTKLTQFKAFVFSDDKLGFELGRC